jgi:regulator of PEP synthase PpsR (kinase-PPPase family)
MDDATFQKELAKYKVVRKADHYKIRFNKHKNEAKAIKAGVRKDITKPKPNTTISTTNTKATNDFWDLLEVSITNLSVKEKAEFIRALKEEHQMVNERINIDDLEAIAASLK